VKQLAQGFDVFQLFHETWQQNKTF